VASEPTRHLLNRVRAVLVEIGFMPILGRIAVTIAVTSPSRQLIVALGLVAGALLAAGCGTTEPNPTVGGATSPAAPGPAAPSSSAARVPGTAAPVPETGAAAERTLRLRYAGGQVSGDTGRVPVDLGTTVTVLVRSDIADEVHLHGYDKTVPVPAGGSARLTFTADIPGVFELELHEAGVPLAQLEVS
jgi:hypothetical protein